MWLSHHHPDQYDRCLRVGGRLVCRRCAVLYPIAALAIGLQLAGVVPRAVGTWIMWLAPLAAVAEWVAEHLGLVGYAPRRQVVVSAIAAPALGIALGRHVAHPFELATVAPMAVHTLACLGAWLVGARRVTAQRSDAWLADFEAAEQARVDALQAQLDALQRRVDALLDES